MKPVLPHAQLDWDDQGLPRSRVFDDVYFSDKSGLDETRYVFLEQNNLRERFAALPVGGRLVIGETGFGTGLNFLCAWQLFEQHAVAGARLHFVSVEKYPLSLPDLQRALALWPELKPFADQLLAQYVAIHQGFQRLILDNGRVILTLLIGDALEQLPQLDAQIDAWFLDGFAPAKNPDMWTAELFAELARLAAPGSTISTFTSTGWVRRLLNAAGFKMKRTPGIGHKWEILRGTFLGWPEQAAAPAVAKPWFARPAPLTGERRALVIGAGLAGCATAASLAARGWQVSLLERHDALAQEASGNPQGVLYLKLSAHGTALSQLIVSGFGYTRRLLEHLQRGVDWDDCGVLQLAFNAKEAERQAQLAAAFPARPAAPARSTAGAGTGRYRPGSRAACSIPEGGWVHPPALCQWQAAHREHPDCCPITMCWNCARSMTSGKPGTAMSCWPAPPWWCWPVPPRSSVFHRVPNCRSNAFADRSPACRKQPQSQALTTVVCAEGYVAPARLGEHTLGASFDFKSDDLTPTTRRTPGQSGDARRNLPRPGHSPAGSGTGTRRA